MKPIVLKTDEKGDLIINAEEIEKMVREAYNEGYADGRNSAVDYDYKWPHWTYPYYTINTADTVITYDVTI